MHRGTTSPARHRDCEVSPIGSQRRRFAKQLKKRTLTNLYNERPTWFDLAHMKLDEAVFDAYGWDPATADDELLAALLALNLARAASDAPAAR